MPPTPSFMPATIPIGIFDAVSVLNRLPLADRRKIFQENAEKLFKLTGGLEIGDWKWRLSGHDQTP